MKTERTIYVMTVDAHVTDNDGMIALQPVEPALFKTRRKAVRKSRRLVRGINYDSFSLIRRFKKYRGLKGIIYNVVVHKVVVDRLVPDYRIRENVNRFAKDAQKIIDNQLGFEF